MPNTPTDTTTTPNIPQDADPVFLSDDPAKISAFIKHRQSSSEATESDTKTPPYNFVDFVCEMTMTDFEDAFQIRAILESQAQLLGTAFQYLMMDGDWKNLEHILRTQKTMRDTIELMNNYPPTSFLTRPFPENAPTDTSDMAPNA